MNAPARRVSCGTPLGWLTIIQQNDQIVGLDWGKAPADTTPLLRDAAEQLQAYFRGALTRFDLPLAPTGTSFQKSVWRAMRDIPYGETVTYGDLANRLSSAPRAIGLACGRNPIPIIIPCHRIVGAGGRLTGYSGGGGLSTKAFLIDLEARDRETPFI